MSDLLKARAQTLKQYLKSKNYDVKHSHCLEAVAQLETGHCYNVAKTKESVRILQFGEKLTPAEIVEMGYSIDVVIPVDLDTLMEGLEWVNEAVSEDITGIDYALCDIGYEVYPYFYNSGCVAIRVTGCIEDESLFEADDTNEETSDLARLATEIEEFDRVIVTTDKGSTVCRIAYYDSEVIGNLGDPDVEDFVKEQMAFEYLRPDQSEEATGQMFTLGELMGAALCEDDSWLVVCEDSSVVNLKFI